MRILAIIDRDLKKFRRNPIVAAMSIMMPILYLIVLGNSFQGKLTDLPLAVVQLDHGPVARQFMENLQAIAAGPATIHLEMVSDQGAALTGIQNGLYKGGLVIPPDFSQRTTLQKRPEVGLFLDNTDGISMEAIRGTVGGALRAARQEYVAIREAGGEFFPREVNLYRQVDYYQSLVPGVVIMAIFLGSLTTGAFNLVMDRFLGTDESYMLTPLSKFDIVGGLILSGLCITTTIALFVFGVSILITGIALDHFAQQALSLIAVVVLSALGLSGLLFVILGRFNHPRIVGVLSGFLNVILFFPSGAMYPIASFPGWLKRFALINPEVYSVHALKAILFKNAGFHAIQGDLLFLALFAGAMLLLAVISFKRQA